LRTKVPVDQRESPEKNSKDMGKKIKGSEGEGLKKTVRTGTQDVNPDAKKISTGGLRENINT